MLTEAQHEQRKQGIGASEIAAIVGANDYQSALTVYMQKTGMTEPFRGNENTRRGNEMEPKIADYYAKKFGVELVESDTLVHPDWEWMLATPDRIYADRSRIIEIKSVSPFSAHKWGPEGSQIVPEMYFLQVQWQMEVTGIHKAHLVAMIGDGSEPDSFRVYEIEYDKELVHHLIKEGSRFWHEHVLQRRPPEPVSDKDEAEYLAARDAYDDGRVIDANQNAEIAMAQYRMAKAAKEQAEADMLRAQNILKKILGTASGVKGEEGRVSYRTTTYKPKTDWEAVAREAGATPFTIKKHTANPPSSRQVRYYPPKGERRTDAA